MPAPSSALPGQMTRSLLKPLISTCIMDTVASDQTLKLPKGLAGGDPKVLYYLVQLWPPDPKESEKSNGGVSMSPF